MTALLLNMELDVSDPRVEVYANREGVLAAAQLIPNRISYLVENCDDLLSIAINGPRVNGSTHRLDGVLLAKIYNAFACRPVRRFENRTVGADRTAKLLLSKFINPQPKEKKLSEVKEKTDFMPKFGEHVTLKADKVRGVPEEHGTVLKVEAETVTVEVDPLYRTGADDDGRRDVELDELAPDPDGTVRMPAETTKSKKTIRAEMKAAKDEERARKKAEREAVAADKKAAKEAARAANGALPKTPRGRHAKYPAEAQIHFLVPNGHACKGSKNAARFSALTENMTYAEACAAGLSSADLNEAVKREWIDIRAA